MTDHPIHTQRRLDLPATDNELQHAYRRTGLKRHGVSYEAAMEDPNMRVALTNLARALLRPAPRARRPR